jgi:hypothetical protein
MTSAVISSLISSSAPTSALSAATSVRSPVSSARLIAPSVSLALAKVSVTCASVVSASRHDIRDAVAGLGQVGPTVSITAVALVHGAADIGDDHGQVGFRRLGDQRDGLRGVGDGHAHLRQERCAFLGDQRVDPRRGPFDRRGAVSSDAQKRVGAAQRDFRSPAARSVAVEPVSSSVAISAAASLAERRDFRAQLRRDVPEARWSSRYQVLGDVAGRRADDLVSTWSSEPSPRATTMRGFIGEPLDRQQRVVRGGEHDVQLLRHRVERLLKQTDLLDELVRPCSEIPDRPLQRGREVLGGLFGVDERPLDPVGVLAAEEVADFAHDEQRLADQLRRFLGQGLDAWSGRR